VDEIRIVMVDMPRMLREIVSTVVDSQPGMMVAHAHPRPVPLVEAVDQAGAHVVIFGHESPQLTADCRELLERRPRVQVMAVSGDGRRTTLYGLRPHREPLGEVEPDQLVEAIRGMVASAGAW
jgi:DNA-binding NarL/FixJ family response regulator